MKDLYLAWRQPEHRWWPVGRLTRKGSEYLFLYTKGAVSAEQAGFRPLLSFPDRDQVYLSRELFPLFANRLMPKTRPDYESFIGWLDVSPAEEDPMVLLARSEGRRETDMFEVFAAPEPSPDGRMRTTFFLHGLRHRPDEAQQKAAALGPSEGLRIEPEPGNAHDPQALRLLTPDAVHVGFVPRYLCRDVHRLMADSHEDVAVTVARVNPPPTPMQFRVLCALDARWPSGFQPLADPDFEPLHAEVAASAS